MNASEPAFKPSPAGARGRRAAVVLCGLALAALMALAIWFRGAGEHPGTGNQREAGVLDETLIDPPPAAEAAAGVRPMLSAAFGLVGRADSVERLHLLRRTRGALSGEETDAALAALLAPPSRATPAGWHAEYIHEICLMLHRAGVASDRFARALLTLAQDAGRPPVIRDYALQHIATLWSAPAAAPIRPAITSALHDLALAGPPVAPAALLALHRLGGADAPPGTAAPAAAGVADEKIAPLVASVFSSSRDTATRMAAVRIVADRRLGRHRADLRVMAADETEPTVLRMAATAAIGRFGDPADADFIASIPADESSLLAGALRHAADSIAASRTD